MKRLVDLHHFDIPESLVQRELDAMVQSERTRRHRIRHMISHGAAGSQEDEKFNVQKFREESLPQPSSASSSAWSWRRLRRRKASR